MITLAGVQLEFPNEYKFDKLIIRGRQLTLNNGYLRHTKNSKFEVSLRFDYLTTAERQALEDIYDSQFEDFDALEFLFEDAYVGGDMGPIDVFMSWDYTKRKINKKYEVAITLSEI